MKREVVKIGGIEFYADDLPKVGNYIFKRKAVVKVCERKNGALYGKVVAVTKRLIGRGRFGVYEPDYAETFFDVSRINESFCEKLKDNPQLCADYRETCEKVNEADFKRNEESYNYFYNEFSKPIHARDCRETSAKFDEWMEKYPIFKIFVIGMAKRRGDMYTSDRECAAITRVWEERF